MKSSMVSARSIFGLAMLFALAADGAVKAQEAQICTLKLMAPLEMQTLPDGRVTIPAQIEGHDYRLMVDTGGYINTLSQQVVKQEGYHPVQTQGALRGMGTTRLDSAVTVKDFTLGHSRGRNFPFYVDDFESLFADGTLAPQILAAYDVDLDFAHSKLNLISPEHCPGAGVYWTKAPAAIVPIEMKNVTHIRIPVMIDGKEINAILDTGASTSFITMRAAKRYLGLDEKDPAITSRQEMVNGMAGTVRTYPFRTLSFGDVQVSRPQIRIVEDKVWSENDLLLGIGILRQLHLYIAYKERRMYITPALAN